MGVSRSDECAERVIAIVQPRYLVKLAVAGAVPLVCRIEATEPDRFAQLCRALRLDETGLTLSQRDRLASVLKTYSDVFALNDEELGTTSVVEHSIDTGDAEPVRQYARRVPYAMRDKLTELVEDMTR